MHAFTNRHRYLANCSYGGCNDGGNKEGEHNNDDLSTIGSNDSKDITNLGCGLESMDLNPPESASTREDKEMELMLLEAAAHIKMARAQRALYQAKVELAVRDATANKDQLRRVYTFVVDYGQNMELPISNKEQPGCTYYFSPLSVFNLGVVNHARAYNDGCVSEHLHCHVYHKGVGKKGANNVASLIIKTLRQLNILRDDSVGSELNVILDNCLGQNKNNTVLRMAVWMMAMNYFKEVNFIFLVVGNTKNAADRLFKSLKDGYRRQNLFTFQDLVETLNKPLVVTVHPASLEDFLDYKKLMSSLFWTIAGNIKKVTSFLAATTDHR